jgi:hypothetical protein
MRIRESIVVTPAVFLTLALAGCPSTLRDACDVDGVCVGPDGGPDSPAIGEGGADVAQPPVGCDALAEPKDAPKCVVSDFGVFVDGTSGADGNAGTRESPVKSIGAALGKLGNKNRIYVCSGTYAEHVKLTSAASVYGGFACGSWSYTGDKAKVAPTDAGYALEVNKVSSAVTIADVSLTAIAGTAASVSSIAALVSEASGVTLTRCELNAGAGFVGKKGDDGAPGMPDKPLDGQSANMSTPGALKTCTCSSGGTTSGGGGGAVVGAGQDGAPVLAPTAGKDGKAGAANTPCNDPEPPKNGGGHTGADAASASDATPITTIGKLSSTGWTPSSGTAGTAGSPGQGGGGGGGRSGAGGGGACGGCGGTGGKGGSGGGASVALASFNATVKLVASTLTSAKGGVGGPGGGGGGGSGGGGGGLAGAGAPNGCGGGDGGKGGNGGNGGGGAGGVTAR